MDILHFIRRISDPCAAKVHALAKPVRIFLMTAAPVAEQAGQLLRRKVREIGGIIRSTGSAELGADLWHAMPAPQVRLAAARPADARRFKSFHKAEIDKWWPLIKNANIGAE